MIIKFFSQKLTSIDEKKKIINFIRFTYKLNEFLNEKFSKDRSLTLKNLLDVMEPEYLGNKPEWRNLYPKKTEKDVFFIN